MENLLKQLYDKPYNPITFSIYNYIDNDGFITELFAYNKTHYDIDDFEYIKFDIDENFKNGVKYSKKDSLRIIFELKNYVEHVLQQNTIKLRIYPIKESGSLIAVKLKEFEIENPEN